MTFEVFYLIEPRPELASHLRALGDPDLSDILAEPVLIRERQTDRDDWTAEAHAARIKLLFLAKLRGEYEPLPADADAARFLGDDRISIEVFDRWWMVRCLMVDDDAEGMASHLGSVLGKIPPTDVPPLDRWLASARDRC